ncbi:MAG: response regulator, partial [Pseudomonas sp.]
SMVYGFVRQSGGQVRLQSDSGHGTQVHLYLPRIHTAALDAPPREPVTQPANGQRSKTVMLVDDEATVRLLVSEVLGDLGNTALTFSDGHSALQVLESETVIDLLISDVGMPGINGHQLVSAARKLRPGLKVLFITGYSERSVFGDNLFDHSTRVLTKPFGFDTLTQRIAQMLD